MRRTGITQSVILTLLSAMADCAAQPHNEAISCAATWNSDWKFTLADSPPNADDSGWETVALPHTPRIEQPFQAGGHFQGICTYRRHFTADPAWRGKKVMLRFDGAMQVADLSLNGVPIARHEGGYLPFAVDLTPQLRWSGDNCLSVRLDNRDNPHVPPGKPLGSLDFTYAGGLYRGVTLEAAAPLHISGEFEFDSGGGVFVRTENLDARQAVLSVWADIRNEGADEAIAAVRFSLLDSRGRRAAAAEVKADTMAAGSRKLFSAGLSVPSPSPWSPEHPVLYTLRTELLKDGEIIETRLTRCGNRTVSVDPTRGLIFNGKPFRIRGANYHQDFPWLGNAVPDNAQYRDIKRLKDAGFNFLRLAHYPHSKAVMEACDELGVMAMVCTPGWQWFDNTPQFVNLARRNIREMIRWHRNHPSAVIWEVSINETYGHDDFYKECCAIAREEYPGCLCAGDSYASTDVSHYDIPYCGWPGNGYNRPAAPGFENTRCSFIREYGDNDTGINTRILRREGETAMLSQAWSHQWTHNTNCGWNWHIGDCLWVGIDHFRGCSIENPISTCGVLEWTRLPKFSYYFFQSQRGRGEPAIFIPHYWDSRPSPARVVVFSNCDEVELRLNGTAVARKRPDDGPDAKLGDPNPEEDMLINYMKTGKTIQNFETMIEERKKQPRHYPLFTGNNCRHLDRAPFTFPLVPYEAGKLEAVGYIDGNPVIAFVRQTPGAPAALRLSVETLDRPLAVNRLDAVFIRAEVVDANGEAVPDFTGHVLFRVSGQAVLASPADAPVEAGIATGLLVSTGKAGTIRIDAQSDTLPPSGITLRPGQTHE